MFRNIHSLDSIKYNHTVAERLKIYNAEYLQNLVFFGQSEHSKRNLITALLHRISGEHIVRTSRTHVIKINNNKVSINFVESPCHFELNLYEYGFYDKHIICEFLKYILTYKNIGKLKYKVIVLFHMDKVSRTAQLALRRIIERQHAVGRFILCCENVARIDKALLSRFIYIRVPIPKKPEIINHIIFTLQSYNKSTTPSIVDKIFSYGCGDPYKTDLILQNYAITGKIDKQLTTLTEIIKPIVDEINKPGLKSISLLRNMIYRYLLLNLTPHKIFNLIFNYYTNHSDLRDEQKLQIINIGAGLDKFHNLLKYDIFILECFILNIKLVLAD